MGDFKVDPPALEQFARTSMDRRDAFDHLRQRMDQVAVPRDSFGHIPGIGHRVYDAYHEFVTGCADGIASAAEAMASVAAAVRGVVTEYQSTDRSAADALDGVNNDLGNVNIRGVR